MMKDFLRAGIILIFFMLLTSGAMATWCNTTDCNTDWAYKQPLTLNTMSLLSSNLLKEHPILIHVDQTNTSFWTNSQILNDINDMRFTNQDSNLDLNYYIELLDKDTNNAYIWVKVPMFYSDKNTEINLYYGNSLAEDTQNETGTMPTTYIVNYDLTGLNDSTGNFNGTGTNTTNTTGKIANAIDFERDSTAYIDLGDIDRQGVFTILSWVKAETLNANQMIFARDCGTANTCVQYRLYFNGTKNFALDVASNTGTIVDVTSDSVPNAGEWYFVNGSFPGNSGTMYFFVNGTQQIDTAVFIATQATTTSNDNLGRRANGEYFDGILDQTSMLNYQITEEESALLYNSGANSLLSFGEQQAETGLDANFNYVIKPFNNAVDFNDTSDYFNVDGNSWRWIINDILESTDQNFSYSTTAFTDLNACLYVSGLGGDSATYSDYICKQFNTGQFEGRITINVYDENNLAELDNVNINFNGVDYIASNTMDINTTLTNTTSSQYTFTFTKTGYGTRYYTIDLNRFSDVNINIALLPSELGLNVEFQVYKTDKTTLYANTYIEMLLNDQQYKVAGRRKTSALGKVTFFINPNDSAYTMRIYGTDGTVDYNSMTLTVNKPKDESTGLTIDGNWELDVTGLAWQTYTNITGSQAIQIYANTFDEYGLEVSDSLANYFPRKYYVSYIGGTTAETLQPYLVDVNDAVNTTIFTISGYTQQPVPSVTIKIYKTVPVDGRVLVEQVTTDEKGEALISMIANQDYEFEIYLAGELLGSQTYRVTSTSTTIYISINDLTITTPILGQAYVNVKFTPNRSKLLGSDTTLTQTISLTDYNYGLTFTSAFIYVTNTDVNGVSGNDVNIYSLITTSQTNSITISSTNQTLDGNSYDTNGYLVVHVIVTTNLGTYTTKYVYSPQAGFDFYKAIGFDLRTNFGCSSTNDPLIPCGGMLFIALLVSILITIAFAMETGFTSQEGMAGLFLVIMGVFTYLAWVPVGIMALMAVSVIMLMIAIGGRNRI